MVVPKRVGSWVQTMPFSINGLFFGSDDATVSTNFILPKTETIAVLSQWSHEGVDPSGSRHLTSHASYVRPLASGAGSVSASLDFGSFDLNSTDISTGSGVSHTKIMLFRIHKFTSPGVTRVHNMKVWASDTSDFLEPQTHKILWTVNTPWPSSFTFQPVDLSNQSYWMPTSLPENQNLFRTGRILPAELPANHLNIVGSGDSDVSQWMSVALGASGTMPLGEYGDTKDGPEGFVIRVTYSVDNLAQIYGD